MVALEKSAERRRDRVVQNLTPGSGAVASYHDEKQKEGINSRSGLLNLPRQRSPQIENTSPLKVCVRHTHQTRGGKIEALGAVRGCKKKAAGGP